jgi:CDP-paratose 2-epimerase
MSGRTVNTRTRKWRSALITGGAGFIGTNLAHLLLSEGRDVLLFDNLSRPGVEQNLDWLRATHGEKVAHLVGDVRDAAALRCAVAEASEVYHFAAQVAVTTSLHDPVEDFEVNARGTLNLLEALRRLPNPPPVVFTSTNKVYGALPDLSLHATTLRYEPSGPEHSGRGVSERRPLDFHSPYGCSKGAADQYMIDYARTIGLTTVVFRMSCIYGPHQFGTEDQGWVAHFLLKAIDGQPITLYGDGRQVRDVLFVDDLVTALRLAQRRAGSLSGRAFNIGGSPANTLSLLELLDLIRTLTGVQPAITFEDWRPGDQRYYVSDISRFQHATGWTPKVGVKEGVARLFEWLVHARPGERMAAGQGART